MSKAYILTQEGRVYNQDGIDFVLGTIRKKFNDYSDIMVQEGALYNLPNVLANQLSRDPDHAYVFISHENGLEIMHTPDDIRRFIDLLNRQTDSGDTSWLIIMKELNLL